MTDQLPPPGQDDEEIEALAMLVAQNLNDGEDPQQIAQQLVDNGWEPSDANGFVGSIQAQLAGRTASQGGGEGMGWLIWIGALLVINLLSYVFNWGFWLY